MKSNILLLLILTILSLFTSCNLSQTKTSPPNVLIILTDDQGWGNLHYHGNDSISTPHLDALAKNSTRFDRFFVSPLCAPTRASLLTGRYHLRTGTSWVTHRKEVMRSEETTMAEIFKSAGYATGCFGKWHSGEQYPNDPNGQGFEEFYGFKAGHWNNYFNTTLTHNQEEVKSKGFMIDDLTDKAIDFIQQNNSENNQKPFLCYVPYNTPHSPFQVPDRYFEKYKKMGLTDKNATVHGMVENIDDNVGRLLQTLAQQQILENTIVIFLTDNGPNGRRYNGGMRGTKGSLHEGGMRVPCFIQWKNHLPADQTIMQNAAHIDLLPTLAELCEIPLPTNLQLDGKSLAPLLNNTITTWKPRNIYHIQTNGRSQMRPAAVRTDQYRLVLDRENVVQLFDMKKDPSETKDLALSLPDVTDSLLADLGNWFRDVTRNGIEPSLVQIGHKESQTINLPAPESQLSGAIKFSGGWGWANDYIIDWKNANDKTNWKVNVIKNGSYQIFLQYNCSEEFTNHSLEVKAGSFSKKIKIENAVNNPFFDSPDRVERGEAYEKEWALQEVGTFDLTEGEIPIEVSLLENNKNGWLQLKGVVIKKVD